jgi:hypothetical protein
VSPSEADLRAALRDGEGDRVDPYDIIHAVRERRAHRRTVLLSAAAAVVFVGAAAAGGAALFNSGSGNNNGGANLAGGNGGGALNAAGNSSQPMRRGAQTAAHKPGFVSMCVSPQIRRTPTNGNESSGSLLSGPVTSFVVCATPESSTGSGHTPQTASPVTVTGAAARSLVASLSNAATSPVRTVCPFSNATTRITLLMTPVTAAGEHLPALSATIESAACGAMVTNGTTTRYGWRLPPRVATLLRVATGPGGPEMPIDLVPSHFHKASGSPSH